MMAGSILIDSLVVVEALQAPGLRVMDRVVWSTSRWPMSLEANSEVPPCSLAEQRKMTVLAQFSTIACAAALYVPETWVRVHYCGSFFPDGKHRWGRSSQQRQWRGAINCVSARVSPASTLP
jgi:hypothetical protein